RHHDAQPAAAARPRGGGKVPARGELRHGHEQGHRDDRARVRRRASAAAEARALPHRAGERRERVAQHDLPVPESEARAARCAERQREIGSPVHRRGVTSPLLADAILVVHAAFVLFVVGGLAAIWIGIAFRRRYAYHWTFRLAHLAAIAFVAIESILGFMCPLT